MGALALANILKSSLGPVGLDKMLVDEVGDVTITNDGATILKQLEVQHPAAKVLVELSQLQDKEVGDGTTSVVILAAELIKAGNELIKSGVSPTAVIQGLQLAKKEACNFIAKNLAVRVETLGRDALLNAAKTSLSSKVIGMEGDYFARMAVDAVVGLKSLDPAGKEKYNIKAINILKAHGKSQKDSELVPGFALNNTRASQAMPVMIKNAKIALLDIDLRRMKMPMGVQVLVTDPSKLEDIRRREGDIIKERIMLLVKAGANVVFTTKGIDDMALKVFVENNMIAVRRCKKADLKNIAKACGGEVMISLADAEGGESVEKEMLAEAECVEECKVGDGELLYIKGCKNSKAQTIVLRGANDYMLDEIERSMHDSMSAVKRVLESKTVVPGGGCVETAVCVKLEHIADTMGTREQLAISAFAQALLVIPKTLAVNGAYDATDLVSKMRAYHNASQTKPGKEKFKYVGLDLDEGKVRDNLQAGVLEPAIGKIKMIKFATEAAIAILRIDGIVKINPKDNPKGPVEDDY